MIRRMIRRINRHTILRWQHYRRHRWEYESFGTNNIHHLNEFGECGWEVIAVGWGKSPYNFLAKRRK